MWSLKSEGCRDEQTRRSEAPGANSQTSHQRLVGDLGGLMSSEQHHGHRRTGRRSRLVTVVAGSVLVVAVATVIGLGANASAQVEDSSCSGTPAVSNSTTNTGLIADCDALLAAGPILMGSGSELDLNWSRDVPISRWDGITVDPAALRVTEIWLARTGLAGSIPAELGNVTKLTKLWLSANEFSGSIPAELGNLTNLRSFYASGNEMSDSIPVELGDLTKLRRLDLSGNDLSGCIPYGLTSLLAGQQLGLSTCCVGNGDTGDVGVATIVVANGWSPADVGAASVLAARADRAVVTYASDDELPAELELLLREASPAEVIIMGGTAAVPRDVCDQIRSASPESHIVRVTGPDRIETAAAAARRVLGTPAESGRVTFVVANGWSPPDIGVEAASHILAGL